MAIGIVTYTLPSSAELLRQYPGKVSGWVEMALSAPGAKEFRAYRSADGKEALAITEYDTLSAAERFLASDMFKKIRSEAEKAGCSNIQVRTWDSSPLMLKPVRARATVA